MKTSAAYFAFINLKNSYDFLSLEILEISDDNEYFTESLSIFLHPISQKSVIS